MGTEEWTETDKSGKSWTYPGSCFTALIYMEGKDSRGLYGKIWNPYLSGMVEFVNIGNLILKLDQLCDLACTPRAEREPHFLNAQMETRYRNFQRELPELSDRYFLEKLNRQTNFSRQKAKEFLQITIRRRAFGSMQGVIRGRIAKNRYVGFCSAMELMKILSLIEI